MPDQDPFLESFKASERYPENVVRHNTYTHTLKMYRSTLNERAALLFCAEGNAHLDIWEYYDALPEFRATVVSSKHDLRAELEGKNLFDKKDPRCRYLFIHARHSRDRLRITRDMFLYAMTYHQVMPEFLEFIFPFGWQEYQDDFHFGGFRGETRLLGTERGLNIRALERTGQDFRMCYALKSVEESGGESWPWSIRETATYHSFEVDTGKALWIIAKGNTLMRDRIQGATETTNAKKYGSSSTGNAFAATLGTHLIVCDWAVENWRWYINFLKRRLEDLTRHSLAIRIPNVRSIQAPQDTEERQPSTTNRRNTTQKSILRAALPTPPNEPSPLPDMKVHPLEVQASCPIPPPPPPLDDTWRSAQAKHVPSSEPEWSFHDFQEVQSIEDKLNTTVQVLIDNTKALQEIKDFYGSLIELQEFPNEIRISCQRPMARFSKRLTNIMNDLQMHKSRAETLLRLVADRKTLLYGILDFRAMEANRLLAKRAQESAERMEDMTKEMNRVALKTKDETVSMKIITLVTLFYLPGTFMSALMSTDIVTFTNEEDGLQWSALRLWLVVTVPLMLLTFIAWAIVYKGVGKGSFKR